MSYVRDNGLARARRRRERRSIAILIFCGLLVLGGVAFATAFMARTPKTTSAACPGGSASAHVPETKKFITNVYNAGGQKGAAGNAAEALRTHDFSVGVVGNDPYRKKIDGVGEVRFGPDGKANAERYVSKYAPGANLVEDGRDGSTIDVVVGPTFPTIQPAPQTESATPTCVPTT